MDEEEEEAATSPRGGFETSGKKMVPFRVLGLDVRVDGGYWRRVSLFSVGCFTLGVRDRMRGGRGVISTEEEDEFGRGGE